MIVVSYICLADAMVESWSVTQEAVGSSPFTVLTNIFVTEFAELRENIHVKTQLLRSKRKFWDNDCDFRDYRFRAGAELTE